MMDSSLRMSVFAQVVDIQILYLYHTVKVLH